MRLMHLRSNGLRACLAAAAACGAVALGASPAAAVAQIASVWEISRVDANRSCKVTLRRDETEPGRRALGAPAGCRKALPILANAAGWTTVEGGALRVIARDGGPLMEFAPKGGGTYEAMGPEGEVYRLTSPGGAPPPRWASEGRVAQAAPAQTRVAPAAVGVTPSRAAIAGRYAILREDSRDTGCMVTLEERGGRGPKGTSRAYLAPACRDQGLVIFDPVGWALTGGKLLLYANKGHSLILLVGPDGKTWSKDPSTGGKPVVLRRL